MVATGSVRHAVINNPSGMARSRAQDDLYWVVNQTGDEPRIFSVRSDGSSVIPTFSKFSRWFDEPEDGKQPWEGFRLLYAEQGQWLDMSSDSNYLYILDGAKQQDSDAVIYAFGEIDPTASTQAAVIKRLALDFPDPEYLTENMAVFTAENRIFLLTDSKSGGLTLLGMETDSTDQVNSLLVLASDETLQNPQAAEVSPNGEMLAVLTSESIAIYRLSGDQEQWLSDSQVVYPLEKENKESSASMLVWESDSELLTGMTSGNIYRIQVDLQQ